MDLLDDLDALDDDELVADLDSDALVSTAQVNNQDNDDAMEDNNDNEDDENEVGVDEDAQDTLDVNMPDLSTIKNISAVAHLLNSKRMKDVMLRITEFTTSSRVRDPSENTGPVEDDPEYKVLVNANNLMFDVDSEILLVHKFIRDKYSSRFPELETLVPNALDFARAVKAIGNEMDLMKLDLKSLLPQSLVMIITVTATATSGKPLQPDELEIVFEACHMAIDLDNAKRSILEYVESRMTFLAPNLTAILGSTTAAKLMGAAGGLTALSKIPACNLLVIGKVGKSSGTGIFAKGQQKHAGFIYYSEMVQNISKDYRNMAARMISAKCCLAARIDRARENLDGNIGRKWREEISKKLEKVQEPAPGKSVKALPIPNDGPKKKRGGKRLRHLKERTSVTEAWKAQNRMKFGEAEEEVIVGDTVRGLGLLGGETGKLLGVAKKHRMFSTPGGATSGLSSSLAFTPVQGIELENPEVLQQQKAAMKDDKYFGGFKRPNPVTK
ncbi:U4/U6 small nuclear ribonucleoprotein Prp31 [Physocladia obscura]|uniref:U4/U6 small nuclear ribonucleoprotein Prp31 n=1 Tax=Physocladia obscura TaxID=109957 RepID=A0AAD5T715_9FUNG|nr:U4/U6 small nuclear ribonucleoprotein Prp31 [Physocladia obscura]